MKIEVTSEDIANGTPGDGCWCPIALAIRRQTEASDVFVSECTAGVRVGDKTRRLDLPPEAVAFIELFDDGKGNSPFSFDLDL